MTTHYPPLPIETKAVHHGRLLVIGACDKTLRIRYRGKHWTTGYEIPYQAIHDLGKTLRRRQDLAERRKRKTAAKKATRRISRDALRWGLSLLATLLGWLYYHAISALTANEDGALEKNLDSKFPGNGALEESLESKFPAEATVAEDFSSDVVGGLRGLGCGKRDAVEAVRRVVGRGVGVGEFEGLFRAALGEVGRS